MYTNGQLSPLIKIKYFYSQFKNPVLAMSLKHLIVMNKYISHLPPLVTILAVKSGHSRFYSLPDKVFFFYDLYLLVWSLAKSCCAGSGSHLCFLPGTRRVKDELDIAPLRH